MTDPTAAPSPDSMTPEALGREVLGVLRRFAWTTKSLLKSPQKGLAEVFRPGIVALIQGLAWATPAIVLTALSRESVNCLRADIPFRAARPLECCLGGLLGLVAGALTLTVLRAGRRDWRDALYLIGGAYVPLGLGAFLSGFVVISGGPDAVAEGVRAAAIALATITLLGGVEEVGGVKPRRAAFTTLIVLGVTAGVGASLHFPLAG